jgi:hypothetical protein
MKSIYNDDRAVSETIGFILIFAIVLTCIGIILLYGNQVLNVTKNQNNFQSIQQGFIVLQSDLLQGALDQAPVKTSMIHLEDGTVFLDGSKGAITISNDVDGTYYTNNTGWITYSSGHDRSQISIENGGLWMHYDDVSNYAVITAPRIYATQDSQNPTDTLCTVVVNVIKLTGDYQAKSGPRTLSIRMEPEDTSVIMRSPADHTVDLSYETDHPYSWNAFLNDSDNLYGNNFYKLASSTPPVTPTTPTSPITVKLYNVKTLIISVHDVKVALN